MSGHTIDETPPRYRTVAYHGGDLLAMTPAINKICAEDHFGDKVAGRYEVHTILPLNGKVYVVYELQYYRR
jgi:hypothetical protein